MKKFKSLFAIISLFTLFLLAACGNNAEETATEKKENDKKTENTSYTVEHAMGTTKLKKHLKESSSLQTKERKPCWL